MSEYFVSRGNRTMIFHGSHIDPDGRATFKPVVVIDPDEIPAAKGQLAPTWLRNLARDLKDDERTVSTSLENVLLFLANAIDETNGPAEPTGLGAVVEDADGQRWVRTHMDLANHWRSADFGGTYTDWRSIDGATVLSDGVTS